MFYVTDASGGFYPYVPGQSRFGIRPGSVSGSKRVPTTIFSALTGAQAPHDPPSSGGLGSGSQSSSTAPPSSRSSSRPPRSVLLLVRQIMSHPVVTLPVSSSLQVAAQLFQQQRVRHMPIVSAEQCVVGLITERDLLRLQGSGFDPLNTKMADVMTTLVLTARPDATIRQLAQVMTEARIGSIPVVNKQGVALGIVTRSDILRAVVDQASVEFWG